MCAPDGIDASVDSGNGVDSGSDTGLDQESADLGACGGPCSGTTPFCDHLSDECVECLTWNDCSGTTPNCSGGNCVECLSGTSCGGETPVCEEGTCGPCATRTECSAHVITPACNPISGECVQCDVANESADCDDNALTPRCNTTGQCVQCRAGTGPLDCTAVTASRCAGNTCAACMNHSDCSHLAATPRCFNNTRCVECTPATEATDCGTESCDPATRTCSGIMRFSRGVCEPCVSDNDCVQTGGTFRCIPMNYQGTPKGGYCMRTLASGCDRPFLTLISATSFSGTASTMYCGIDQDAVTCEAVNALRSSTMCPGGNVNACMGDGALCATVGAAMNRCTYACSSPDECLMSGPGATCGAGYCGS